jgi:CBS domain-containing protein
MVANLMTIGPDEDVSQGLLQLRKHGRSGMPVVDQQRRYLGVFSEKCCLRLYQQARDFARQGNLPIRATEIMATNLYTLRPDEDALKAIGQLLDRKFSGAPVTDSRKEFLGMFSEKTSMQVLIDAAYDSIPTSHVSAFMDTDRGRLIDEGTAVERIVEVFVGTAYRRLPIVRDGILLGQVNRSDVLRMPVRLPPMTVREAMDTQARTISPDVDLLGMADIFLHTPFRRLPVLSDGKLIGQVSRRDVLMSAYHWMDPAQEPTQRFLHVSAVRASPSERLNS